ncbi:MAG: hypothetical protein R3D58_13580 [Saprospiraceae bacterium]
MKKIIALCILVSALAWMASPLQAQSTGKEPEYRFVKTVGEATQGSILGIISFQGRSLLLNKTFAEGAAIRAVVTGNPTSGFLPTSLYFSTGTDQLRDRLAITEAGLIGINTTQPAARLALQHFYEPGAQVQALFQLEGGTALAPRYFRVYNEGPNTLKALLEGDLTISQGGDLTIAQGDARLLKGQLNVQEGDANLEQGDLLIKKGRVELHEGDVLVGKGRVELAENDLILNNGQILIKTGDLQLNQGQVDLEKGNLLLREGQLILGAVPVLGDYSILAERGIMTEKIKVALKSTADWSDDVLAPDYELPSLEYVEEHICEKGHLPGLPSAEDLVHSGIDLAKMDAALLKKIEELTLYVIGLQAQNIYLQNQINQLLEK